MGYYTRHDVSNNSEEVIQALHEVSGYGYLQDSEIKWYNCKEDCKEVSRRFPDQLITVEGVGEDHPDIWGLYAKNGRVYQEEAKMILPEFEETKLK